MLDRQLLCLLALDKTRSVEAAARACGLDRGSFLEVIAQAEQTFGRPLVRLGDGFEGFTLLGEIVLKSARGSGAQPLLLPDDPDKVSTLLGRRSVSPKRLGMPGPGVAQLELMLRCALSAPDHGGLRPWRVIHFPEAGREALATLFEQEKRRRDPLAPADDLKRAREHALRPPVLLGFVVSPQARAPVPLQEQWLAAGAALGNLLNAAHALGFGAIVLSGERCHDDTLTRQLGLGAEESLAGFVSLGQVVKVPPARKAADPRRLLSSWSGVQDRTDTGVTPR